MNIISTITCLILVSILTLEYLDMTTKQLHIFNIISKTINTNFNSTKPINFEECTLLNIDFGIWRCRNYDSYELLILGQ
jgi:hypothetical protein